MANFLNRRTLTQITRLCTGFVMLAGFGTVDAAQLKDIRVGEYNEFTRIVFELDGPTANPDIEILPSGRLLVTFKKAGISLIRKIPVERSPQIKDIQLWQRKGGLSALLISRHAKIRIESFRLSRPPRFAVDIFPVAAKLKDASVPGAEKISPPLQKNDWRNASEVADENSPSTVRSQPSARPDALSTSEDKASPSDKKENRSSPTARSAENSRQPTPEKTPPVTQETSVSEKPSAITAGVDHNTTSKVDVKMEAPVKVDRSGTASVAENEAHPPSTLKRTMQSSKPKSSSVPEKSNASNNRLQLYLVVTLVIITIVILLMLLLMLLTSRHRLSSDKTARASSKRLQNQA